ncbi:MAG: hypothetical protein IT430_03630 [Phycisphaerales bacterium]|nr:hypothetical protein [Phycisphaerales bacterium]
MPHYRPTPPQLATLHTKPSWHNRAGRTDRSACIELRTSELWRHADFPPHRLPGYNTRLSNAPAPASPSDSSAPPRPRGTRPCRIAIARVTLDARFLNNLHEKRKPQQLAGDLRSRKSNIMKCRYREAPYITAANPNKGATRLKRLGLPADDWTQTIAVERWFFPLPPRFDPYLNCMQPRYRLQHFLQCPRCKRKVTKLFLPLCTADEYRDAGFAQEYITLLNTHPLTRNAPATPLDAAIATRYTPLFQPRTLLCRTCLHLRYGEARGKRAGHFR